MKITLFDNPEARASSSTEKLNEIACVDFGSNLRGERVRKFLLSKEHNPSRWCLWEGHSDLVSHKESQGYRLLATCGDELFTSESAAASALLSEYLREHFQKSDLGTEKPSVLSAGASFNIEQINQILAEAASTETSLALWSHYFLNTGCQPPFAEFIASEPRLLSTWSDALGMWDFDLYGVIHESELIIEDEELSDYVLPPLEIVNRESVLRFMHDMAERVEQSYPNALSVRRFGKVFVAVESSFQGKGGYQAESLYFFLSLEECHSHYHSIGCYLNADSNAQNEVSRQQDAYLINLFNEKVADRLQVNKLEVI